jgi:hypothetical protein
MAYLAWSLSLASDDSASAGVAIRRDHRARWLTVGKVEAVIDVSGAMGLAEAKLAAALPRRWRHVRSAARRARWAAKQLSLSDALVAQTRSAPISLPKSDTGGEAARLLTGCGALAW